MYQCEHHLSFTLQRSLISDSSIHESVDEVYDPAILLILYA